MTGVLPNLAHAQNPSFGGTTGPWYNPTFDKGELSSYKVPPSDAASTFQQGTMTYFLTKNSDNTYSIFYKDQGAEFYSRVTNRVLSPSEFKTSIATDKPTDALDSTIPLVGRIIGAILIIIQWFLGKLIYTAGLLLDGVLGIKNFTKVGTVQHGWTVIRDLCNMLFALILLIIAFATILHLESYGMKQLLWKLVVAAILINFSFTLAGVIIDFSQVLTNFFVENSKSATTGGQISATLILKGLSFNNLFGFDGGFLAALSNAGITTWAGPSIGTLIDLLLIIILLAVALFAVLALAILFLIRIIALWIILIFAPLAWLCMVLPATKSIWDKWWDYLLKYSFFAPIATFLLYLSILLIQKGEIGGLGGTATAGVQKQYISSFLNNPMNFMQYILVIGLLVASVLVARSMGIMGASAVISMGKGAKSLALGAIAGGTAAGGIWAGRRALVGTGSVADRAGAGMAAKAEQWKTQGGIVKRQFGRALGQASRPLTAYSERSRQEIARQEKAYASMSGEHLKRELPFAAPAGQAAIMKLLAEKSPRMLEGAEKYLPTVERIGGDMSAILTAKPDWAKSIGQDTKHWTAESLRKGMVSKWDAKTAANPEVQDALRELSASPQAYANIINSWAGDVRDEVLTGLKSQFQDTDFTNPEMMKKRKAYAQITGNLTAAFKDSGGAVNESAASQHIQTMTAQLVAQMKEEDKDSHDLFGQYMTKIQAVNIGKSGAVSSQTMVNIHQAVPAGEVRDFIEKSEAWGAQRTP